MLFRLIRLYIPSALMTLSTSRANNFVEAARNQLLRKQVHNKFIICAPYFCESILLIINIKSFA